MMKLSEHSVTSLKVRGFTISEEVWHAGVLRSHEHVDPHLAIIFDGQVVERTNEGSRVIKGISSVYFPARTAHELEFRERTTFISIDIAPERSEMARELFGDEAAYALFPAAELLPLSARLRDELRRHDSRTTVALEGIALELLAQSSRLLGRGLVSVPGAVHRARRLIDERHANRIGLSDVAAMVDLSPVRLAESFRRAFDCTVGDYIRRKRVEHAIDLLVNSHMKLGEIALEAGFCDQPHLVRVFKAQTGMTPSRYRRACLDVSTSVRESPHASTLFASV